MAGRSKPKRRREDKRHEIIRRRKAKGGTITIDKELLCLSLRRLSSRRLQDILAVDLKRLLNNQVTSCMLPW